MSSGRPGRSGGGRVPELIGVFSEALAQVLESMTDQRPSAEWEAASGLLSTLGIEDPDDILWWAQPFEGIEQPAVWVGTPRATWEELGGRTLRAAGLETVELADARNTWMEVLSQALSSLARSTGGVLGREINCGSGSEQTPPADADEWVQIRLRFEAPLPPLWLTLGTALLAALESAAGLAPPPAAGPETGASPAGGGYPRTLDLLLDVELPVSISFGRTQIPMRDVLKLTTGSIVELNRDVSDPVEVLVNQSLIARGEVVVIDGNYGVRIQEVVSAQDRLRSVR
jgi:flagellar motor switch protein FliN